MCSICLHAPCLTGCPNAPEQMPKYTCSICGYGIYPGDKYLDGVDGEICENCLDDMTTTELIKLFGEDWKTYD